MPDLEIREPGPEGEAFVIVSVGDYAQTTDEQAWCDRVNSLTKRLSEVETDENAPPLPQETQARDRLVERLRAGAHEVVSEAQPARDGRAREALYDTYWDEGIYTELLARTETVPFTVKPVFDTLTGAITDIAIVTRDARIPAEKQQFKTQLDQVLTVVRAVLSDDADLSAPGPDASFWERAKSWLARLTRMGKSVSPQFRRTEYLRGLLGIAEVGLMNADPTQTPFATYALSGFKDDFVAREAGRVKNRYVRRLGQHALLAMAVAVLCYALTISMAPDNGVFCRFRNFFVLAAGAAVGTWLSFSIRRQVLSFADLATLEDDRLNPGIRVLFMVALTTVVGLILWTGMVRITIGDFKTDFQMSGSFAALIGALCGIAERSLAGAVGRRATEFVAGIGEGARPTP